jgi:hypothetical protein
MLEESNLHNNCCEIFKFFIYSVTVSQVSQLQVSPCWRCLLNVICLTTWASPSSNNLSGLAFLAGSTMAPASSMFRLLRYHSIKSSLVRLRQGVRLERNFELAELQQKVELPMCSLVTLSLCALFPDTVYEMRTRFLLNTIVFVDFNIF